MKYINTFKYLLISTPFYSFPILIWQGKNCLKTDDISGMLKCTGPEKQKAAKGKILGLLVHIKFLNKIINKIHGIDQPVN